MFTRYFFFFAQSYSETILIVMLMISLQIKKFKDALAKHSPDRCSLCPTKGLEEKELLALSANRDLSFVYDPLPKEEGQVFVPEREREEILSAVTSPLSHEAILPLSLPLPLPLPLPSTTR